MKPFVPALFLSAALTACGGSSHDHEDAGTDAAVVSQHDLAVPAGCSEARAQLIGDIDKVSSGSVSVTSSSGGVTTLFVDASAGGEGGDASHPWTFVSLATDTKVSVTDVSSTSSSAWDLAFKRPLIYTNDGDGGPGMGGRCS